MSIKAAVQILLFVNLINGTVWADNTISVDQVGDTNQITITQASPNTTVSLQLRNGGNIVGITQGSAGDSGGHSQSLYINGTENIIDTTQLNMGGVDSGHLLSATILGNANRLTVLQQDNTTKTQNVTINGNSNVMNLTQSGTGAHSLTATLNGNGNSLTSSQTGSGSHSATIELTNGGGPSSLDLSQSGSTNKSYSLSQTCLNPAGCSASVSQH